VIPPGVAKVASASATSHSSALPARCSLGPLAPERDADMGETGERDGVVRRRLGVLARDSGDFSAVRLLPEMRMRGGGGALRTLMLSAL
jgi:hypothetical protein